MARRATEGYIDQGIDGAVTLGGASVVDSTPHQFDDAQSSGSSVEEESEGEPFDDDIKGSSDDLIAEQLLSSTLEDDYEDHEADWDVDDEDWELANGARNAPDQPSTSKTSQVKSPASTGVAMNPKVAHERQEKDKSDRATQDQVLDSRTRLVLAGLVNRNVIGKIERCANVYFASPGVAVKIYRTSILNFRSRSNYIVGEQRFRSEYTSSKNPRKMIRVWAEKELRNLRRLVQGGIRAPTVHDASPRLKDVNIEAERLDPLYAELLIAVRRMYQHCHLVHADLSEYNILLHQDHLWIIDVSQSVEHDHPKAFDFLRADLQNVEDFFGRLGVKCLGLRKAWEFAVTENIGITREEELGADGDGKLAGIITEWVKQPSSKTDDAVFLSSYIPRTLAEVYDPERDVDLLKRGGGDELIYAGVTGLKLADKQEPDDAKKDVKEVRFEEETPEAGSESEEDSDDEPYRPRGFRHEDKDAKKERKKAVKEENREKRKKKMPKAEKQRLMKKSQK
ncbi:uncharacterized protein IL334_004986 [Kwoniella shivajii]|uniref:Serine/threonine-protein kinase RIO1 n=1 Tax=Kwoniella shivajii TaxID=564305 RepID=A0ABZ1D2C4_9TREE|nr:hypothetical protein IL334_004986 [Kwoniella shivajii]